MVLEEMRQQSSELEPLQTSYYAWTSTTNHTKCVCPSSVFCQCVLQSNSASPGCTMAKPRWHLHITFQWCSLCPILCVSFSHVFIKNVLSIITHIYSIVSSERKAYCLHKTFSEYSNSASNNYKSFGSLLSFVKTLLFSQPSNIVSDFHILSLRLSSNWLAHSIPDCLGFSFTSDIQNVGSWSTCMRGAVHMHLWVLLVWMSSAHFCVLPGCYT